MSDILIAVFLTAGVENFSGLPRGGFLIRTGTLRPTTLLLIFCDATLVVVFSLHLLNAEAKLWTVVFFKATAIVCPQYPSELYLGQLESHLFKPFSQHDIRCGNPFDREYDFTINWQAANAGINQSINESINQSMYFKEKSKLHNLQIYINIFYFYMIYI